MKPQFATATVTGFMRWQRINEDYIVTVLYYVGVDPNSVALWLVMSHAGVLSARLLS
jgi:hypothetical protein